MQLIKKYKYELILFIIDAIGMILELVASRVLSPYFGSSNMVWTCVIAIILLSSSIGHYYGGKIADSEKPKEALNFILVFASLFVLLIPFLSDNVISTISMAFRSRRIGAILATALTFLFPSILLGLVSPIVLKLRLNNLDDAGKIAGKISAFSTLGAILGTILGGFFLIPNFGCMNILFFLTIALALLRVLHGFELKDKTSILAICLIVVSLVSIFIFSNMNTIASEKVLNGELDVKVSEDTQYGRVLIYNYLEYSEDGSSNTIRVMNVDNGYETGTFTDNKKKYTPSTAYIKKYGVLFEINPNANNLLMIGGAGYSFPKWFISSRESGNIDVVEIDEELTELAYKYFHLNDLTKDFDLEKNKRLNIIHDDGRMYLNQNSKKYDAILNDAFTGDTPAKTLTTIEAVARIKESLNENGVYLTNIIASLEGKDSRFLMAEGKTISKYFNHIYIIPVDYWKDEKLDVDYKTRPRNIMLVATDKAVNIKEAQELKFSENEFVFSDDFCPVESMTYYN